MTEQKQIEEIVDVMTASNNPFIDIPTEQMTKVAEALYNAGYRKVLLDTKDGYCVDIVQYAPWQLIEGYTEREVARTRKETAKEIVDRFRKYDSYFDDYEFDRILDDIEIDYGIEVEE